MKPVLAVASVALALVLSACASQTVWHKEGAEEEDLRLAQRTCSREAERYGFAFEGARNADDTTAGERRAGSAGGGVYRECMERQGWRRYRDTAPR
ncbi:MAG: hypothetical protein JNK67_23690 [Alphaproteobacteria bacterium]|nr:hypothetical protein [Alphaproteobacteria bacterium]